MPRTRSRANVFICLEYRPVPTERGAGQKWRQKLVTGACMHYRLARLLAAVPWAGACVWYDYSTPLRAECFVRAIV